MESSKNLVKVKIGNGYLRSGYGRTSIRKCNIYLIDGYAYAKDKPTSLQLLGTNEITEQGYVPVNIISSSRELVLFYQASLHTKEHQKFEQTKKYVEVMKDSIDNAVNNLINDRLNNIAGVKKTTSKNTFKK